MAEGLAGVFGNPILRAVTLATATFIFCHSAYSAAFLLHLTKDLEFDSRIVSVVLGIGALGGVVGAVGMRCWLLMTPHCQKGGAICRCCGSIRVGSR
ncbi:hypothetical protein ACVIGA_005879 [Bradyrhizobium sp. USDA 3240]